MFGGLFLPKRVSSTHLGGGRREGSKGATGRYGEGLGVVAERESERDRYRRPQVTASRSRVQNCLEVMENSQ